MYTHHQQQHNILDVLTPEEFDKHAIIKPPGSFEFVDNDKKYTRLVVDSTFRDQSLYPNPNDYYFAFDDDINDVASAKLVSIDVPLSTYTTNLHFNTLWVVVGAGNEVAVSLDHGKYTAESLATMIQNKLNSAGIGATFTVTFSTILEKFTFSASLPFTFNFAQKTNSLHSLLGFKPQNYTSTNNLIEAPFKCNLEFNNYIVMCIDGFDNNKSNSKPLNKSFAVISKNYANLNISDVPDITKGFNPPLSRLAKIHISFFDKYGNPYDFQNMDHRMEILFHSFKQRRKYQNIFGVKPK